jgi:four helix bundle protein
MSEKIQSFRDLRVYKNAFELQQEIFIITKQFPAEEKYSLTDQIRRSSRSTGSNIAEAWQKRKYMAHFQSKLTDSDGENAETEHWIETAFACKYISEEQKNRLLEKCVLIGKMLGSMMFCPEKFCKESN